MTREPGLGAAFNWRARDVGSVLYIRFSGELDIRVASIAGAGLRDPMDTWHRTVVVDMSDVSFMDSSGLRLLIRMKQDVDARQGRFVMARPSPQVERVVGIAGLDRWFDRLDEDDGFPCPVCDGIVSTSTVKCERCGSAL